MPQSFSPAQSRRGFLRSSLRGLGAVAGGASLLASGARGAPTGRKRDVVRLTWGMGGLTLIAKERGEFEKALAKEGVETQWLGPFPNHAPTLQAVTGGSADFSFGGSTTPALATLIAGSPLVFTQFAVYEPRTSAIIARNDSGIARVEDLAGRSVAVNRSGLGEFLLVAALEKHNVPRASVKFVYLNPPDAAPALASGKVDAWSIWSPMADIAKLDYKAHDIFVEGRDLDFQIDFGAFLAPRKFVAENPDLVRAVNAAFAKEAQWISANTREAEYITQKKSGYSDQIRDRFIGLKRQYRLHPPSDRTFVAELQNAANWLTARKILPAPVTVADHLAQI
ncbi:MAG: sulfonate ABC transporter substrate-binding protein [Methylocystaceae bacterium]|nr:MAG: sulfonate ABC transporter substrate-binding protein [Methylocystaceae bacterium]